MTEQSVNSQVRAILAIADYADDEGDLPAGAPNLHPRLTSDALRRAHASGELRNWATMFSESLKTYRTIIATEQKFPDSKAYRQMVQTAVEGILAAIS